VKLKPYKPFNSMMSGAHWQQRLFQGRRREPPAEHFAPLFAPVPPSAPGRPRS